MDLNTLLNAPPSEWPADAGEVSLRTLVDKQAGISDRLIAAELVGNLVVMNDKIAYALLTIVGSSDEPEELRAKAAISLGPVLEQGDLELLDDDESDSPECAPISLDTFHDIQEVLRKLYLDASNPKRLRRKILEAAVRAPQHWQMSAISAAYSNGDKDWMLTAVFAMRWVRGFDDQILEALESTDPEIHYHAVNAAGGWELDSAWPHVVTLVENPSTPKGLLLAAIEAVSNIRPQEAQDVLRDLTDSRDEDIAGAACEAVSIAQARSGEADDEDELDGDEMDEDEMDEDEGDDGKWIN